MPGVERSVVIPTLEQVLALDDVDSEFGLAERVTGIILPIR